MSKRALPAHINVPPIGLLVLATSTGFIAPGDVATSKSSALVDTSCRGQLWDAAMNALSTVTNYVQPTRP